MIYNKNMKYNLDINLLTEQIKTRSLRELAAYYQIPYRSFLKYFKTLNIPYDRYNFIITKEKLEDLLKRFTIGEVADQLNVSYLTIQTHLKKYNLNIKDIKKQSYLGFDKETFLQKLEDMSLEDFAKQEGINHTRVRRVQQRLGVRRKPRVNSYKFEISKSELEGLLKSYTLREISELKNIKYLTLKTHILKYGIDFDTNLNWSLVKKKMISKGITKQAGQKASRTAFEKIGQLKEWELLNDKERLLKYIQDNHIINFPHLMSSLNIKNVESVRPLINSLDIFEPNAARSGGEQEITLFIKQHYSGSVIENSRKVIPPFEIDIYLPELNLAFEFNGKFYHNSNKVYQEFYKEPNYHANKRRKCAEKGIRLIQIWDFDYENKKSLIKEKILHLIGQPSTKPIYARKCEIKELTKPEAKEYLNINHLKGYSGTCARNIGLVYNEEIVACLSYSKPKNGRVELKRYAGKVVGGLERLFKHTLNDYRDLVIFTQIDLDWSDPLDNQYVKKLGFIHKKNTSSMLYVNSKNEVKPRTAMGWHLYDYYLNPELTSLQEEFGYIETWNKMENPNISDLLYLCNKWMTVYTAGAAQLEYTPFVNKS